ncbi:hypothetical protein VWP49_23895, partial [Xanthomonas citri pv. citri]
LRDRAMVRSRSTTRQIDGSIDPSRMPMRPLWRPNRRDWARQVRTTVGEGRSRVNAALRIIMIQDEPARGSVPR